MLWIVLFLVIINFLLLLWLLLKSEKFNFSELSLRISSLEKNQERLENLTREEIARNREELSYHTKSLREEISSTMSKNNEMILSTIDKIGRSQKEQLDIFSSQLVSLTQGNEQRLERIRNVVEEKMVSIQQETSKRLDEIRSVVDEKLHSTLESRLGEAFKQVSERLELVHRGLGEMQSLAASVGDLKNVLSNVKTSGILGEVILENMLSQVLSPEQYEKNVVIKEGSEEKVEFAIKLPKKDRDKREIVYLPIDSKFPKEYYHRLLEAQSTGDRKIIESAKKELESRVKKEAGKIKEKYIFSPKTTEFGIMFLPFEGLYAEVLNIPGLCETLQNEYNVVVTGPTTLYAFLNILHIGFRTLAIEQHSAEVWKLLLTVKTEFSKFGDILEKTQKKLYEASESIETASRKSRAIELKLKSVEELPSLEKPKVVYELPEEAENIDS